MNGTAAGSDAAADTGPVTVVVTRRVRAGREAGYEAWLARLQSAARGLPGYLGVRRRSARRPVRRATT
ncbi:MAG: hypothetical protein KF683_19385 [Rubrivivax sp.]|nr:hypothetical protein [Rubrivivax sp.]